MRLSESTTAASGGVTSRMEGWSRNHLDREFMRIGSNVVESEDLTNKLYEFYLALISTGWVGAEKGYGAGSIADIGHAYQQGFYYPCVERVVLTSQIDIDNDGLPEYAGFIDDASASEGMMFHAARRAAIPRGWASPLRGTSYLGTLFYRLHVEGKHKKELGTDPLQLQTWPSVVDHLTGRVIAAIANGRQHTGFGAMSLQSTAVWVAITLNAWADRLHLWNIETSEPVISKDWRTPLRLGVSEEHVKSLFYARETPVTETGRKRPILHWVQAHQRRLQAGIDVDVRRHMRGVIEFEMAGFPFRITNPVKVPVSRRAA